MLASDGARSRGSFLRICGRTVGSELNFREASNGNSLGEYYFCNLQSVLDVWRVENWNLSLLSAILCKWVSHSKHPVMDWIHRLRQQTDVVMSHRSELIQKTNLTENKFLSEETIRMQMMDASSKGARGRLRWTGWIPGRLRYQSL